MRLLERDEHGVLGITDDLPDREIPPYAIVSHTWGAAREEVTLQDYMNHNRRSQRRIRKAGHDKILFCSGQAARDGYRHVWIDTCCIDKTNLVELSEAINSMFRWYRQAAKCYVFMSDVTAGTSDYDVWGDDFRRSRWFTRGWTLQELLAPRIVEFFSSDGVWLGDKASLENDIHVATGIAVDALRGRPLADFSVSERMSWAANRETTRKEDEAYSLLGIFDVYMPLIYGERNRALVRLHDEINKSLQGPGSVASDPTVSASSTSISSPHPVKTNYRRVHVTILHWESDKMHEMVRRMSDTFRILYRYDVREILLPHKHRVDLNWPWTDPSLADYRDLQIVYYLGSTVPYDGSKGDARMRLQAAPSERLPDQDIYPEDPNRGTDIKAFPGPLWLDFLVRMPALESDAFIILDCFVDALENPESAQNVEYLQADDDMWARYVVLFAGYTNPTAKPGKLSDKLMSQLEKLASSGNFYAREGLITSGMMRARL